MEFFAFLSNEVGILLFTKLLIDIKGDGNFRQATSYDMGSGPGVPGHDCDPRQLASQESQSNLKVSPKPVFSVINFEV